MTSTPGSILDGVRTVLFAHAHPDDETLSSGALIAELAARDIRVVLVTATRGERGEVVAGPLSALAGTTALSAHREQELRGACQVLGVSEQHWLGAAPACRAGTTTRYVDSGMRWIREGLAGPADDVSPGAFSLAPLDDVVADLGALLGAVRPDLLISYDHGGGYGHPDHVRMHVAAAAAAQRADLPFAELVHDRAMLEESPETSEWFVLEHRLRQVTEALGHHASQLTVEGTRLVHSGGQREDITTSVGLRLRRAQSAPRTRR
ncbi:PIG-L family deacetylase [Plantibacter flavus]|uniref:PIG-L family deacetylase n=1 Tax=Plantibacter flavus TaxID=150123 RepID=UPI003F18B7B6